MSDWTPTADDFRDCWHMTWQGDLTRDPSAEFDRWLTAVKAEAWEEGLSAGADRWMDFREFGNPPINPYRQEQDQ